MRIMSVISTKGGVGKTTVTANLGGLLADTGLRGLFIDLDSQPTLSSYYPLRTEAPGGTYELIALSERHQRRLVVAGVASLRDIFLQDWLSAIYRDYPRLGVRAQESTPLRVVEKLEQNMIDVGFLYDTAHLREVGVEEVATIPLVMVAGRPGIEAERAVGEGYIRVEWATAFASVHESHFPQRLLVRGRVNSGRIALNLLLECGGAAYLPQDIVAPWCRRQRLFVVEDAPPIGLKAYVAYHLHSEHRELIRELLKRLR